MNTFMFSKNVNAILFEKKHERELVSFLRTKRERNYFFSERSEH